MKSLKKQKKLDLNAFSKELVPKNLLQMVLGGEEGDEGTTGNSSPPPPIIITTD